MYSSPPLQTPTYFLMANISKSTLLNLKIETWKLGKLQKTIKIPKIDEGGKWPLKTLLFTKRKRTRAEQNLKIHSINFNPLTLWIKYRKWVPQLANFN